MDVPPRRHYIIVVHGIGEQRLNETTTPVVHRFADVRNPARAGHHDLLLPAYLSAQSVRHHGLGHRWSEFEGIPIDEPISSVPFTGAPATNSGGRNFRFVDLYWSHILDRHQQIYSSPTSDWAKALQERLRHAPPGWLPAWADHLLTHLIDTALPAEKLLSLYDKNLAKRIFRDFLGDVHLYGDYARTRGKAVRHFHVVLDEIHIRDFIQWCRYGPGGLATYRPPAYTIIAHSLGSIMSFDALVYSRVNETIREAVSPVAHPAPSLPFPGYLDEEDNEGQVRASILTELQKVRGSHEVKSHYQIRYESLNSPKPRQTSAPLLQWRNCIQNFVTLGSPIDKYHVLWFQNYYHMGLRMRTAGQPAPDQSGKPSSTDDKAPSTAWVPIPNSSSSWTENWLEDQAPPKIRHYNLCDEQDPVGHHLDVAQATTNYHAIFEETPPGKRDIVFRRYAVPGVAHVKYWEDRDLFQGIIKEVIEQAVPSGSFFSDKSFREKDESVYRIGQEWAYFRIPLITTVITYLLLVYGLSEAWDCAQDCDFQLSHILALSASILLWVCPNPRKAYAKEASTDTQEQKTSASFMERWKPRPGIFAHLISGAVEWRQVLKHLRQRDLIRPDTGDDLLQQGGFLTLRWPRYLVAGALVIIPALWLLWPLHPIIPLKITWYVLGFGVMYSFTLAYVTKLYRGQARKNIHAS